MALDCQMVAAILLLGGNLETVQNKIELAVLGSLYLYRFLLRIQLSFLLSNGIVYFVGPYDIDIIDWKLKQSNRWVDIEINQGHLHKASNFYRFLSFTFQYTAVTSAQLNRAMLMCYLCFISTTLTCTISCRGVNVVSIAFFMSELQ